MLESERDSDVEMPIQHVLPVQRLPVLAIDVVKNQAIDHLRRHGHSRRRFHSFTSSTFHWENGLQAPTLRARLPKPSNR